MKKHLAAFALGTLILALSGPVLADSFTLSIGTPPPAPVIEAVPVSPGPEYAWRPGYWRWVDERHVWIPGHWAHRPHPNAEWAPPHWDRHEDGYHFEEGHWR